MRSGGVHQDHHDAHDDEGVDDAHAPERALAFHGNGSSHDHAGNESMIFICSFLMSV